MEKVLKEIETAITAPETKWHREDERLGAVPEGATVFHGDSGPWRLLVVSQGASRMGTATHLKQLLIVKMTDQLAQTALSRARAVLG